MLLINLVNRFIAGQIMFIIVCTHYHIRIADFGQVAHVWQNVDLLQHIEQTLFVVEFVFCRFLTCC